jgi:acyl-CoA dehydrogenase
MTKPLDQLEPVSGEKVVAQARAALKLWERNLPGNFYDTDQHLQNILEYYWGTAGLERHRERLSTFGGQAATIVDLAVRNANLPSNLPRLERYNAAGERIEDVVHSADHDLAGRYIYGSGAMSVYAKPGNNLLALALFYLSSYNGEAGHNCPLACTAGIIKTLQEAGSEELQEKYLARLLDPNYEARLHGAQFLTEVQGGSDVGANAVTARLLDEKQNKWLINGEKWFCSNVTADLALVTARPEGAPGGTRGLGLFLLPRRLDDSSPNGVFIRRLKDKLGTRSLATAEVDFQDAVAYQIGGPGRGFAHAMEFVINTSRLYNAVGSAAATRRAYLIAWTYAQHRQAFGAPIKNFPLIQETLAEMRCVAMALTSGSLSLAHLRDEIETDKADEAAKKFFRLAVNLHKYRSSISSTDMIRRAIEIIGGNGVVETFSILPRLLRDSLIFETWEGAHNTLLAQSVRDIQRYKLHFPFFEQLARWFGSLRHSENSNRGLRQIEKLRADLDDLLTLNEPAASLLFKPLADRMMWLFYIACLARQFEWEEAQNRSAGNLTVIDWLWQKHIENEGRKDLSSYLQQISDICEVL